MSNATNTQKIFRCLMDIAVGTGAGLVRFEAGKKYSQKQLAVSGVRGFGKYFKAINTHK